MFVLPPGTSSAAKPTTTPASPARCWRHAFESAKAVATNASSMPRVTPTVACASGPVGVARRRVGGSWPLRKQRPRDTLHPSPDAVAAETPPELAVLPTRGLSRTRARALRRARAAGVVSSSERKISRPMRRAVRPPTPGPGTARSHVVGTVRRPFVLRVHT
jgi:hypothetical protein